MSLTSSEPALSRHAYRPAARSRARKGSGPKRPGPGFRYDSDMPGSRLTLTVPVSVTAGDWPSTAGDRLDGLRRRKTQSGWQAAGRDIVDVKFKHVATGVPVIFVNLTHSGCLHRNGDRQN